MTAVLLAAALSAAEAATEPGPLDRLEAALTACDAGAKEAYAGANRDRVLLALEEAARTASARDFDGPRGLSLRARSLLVLGKGTPARDAAARLVEATDRAPDALELLGTAELARFDAFDRRLADLADPAGDPRAVSVDRARRAAAAAAAAAFRDAIAGSPSAFRRFLLAKALAIEGLLLDRDGRRDEAKALFERVARDEVERMNRDGLDAGRAFAAQATIGWAECERDPSARADLLGAATKLDPANHLAWFSLGIALAAIDRTAAAREALLRALSLAADPAAWSHPLRLYFHGALDHTFGRDRGRFRQSADGIGMRVTQTAIRAALAEIEPPAQPH
ncbi:MAG: hypothetical protein JXP34_20165 [Planctomycetes bacterium]|nr:hypothetical protein [Planctomycetota bacterium]